MSHIITCIETLSPTDTHFETSVPDYPVSNQTMRPLNSGCVLANTYDMYDNLHCHTKPNKVKSFAPLLDFQIDVRMKLMFIDG